ncbi:MAG: TIM44-like domain-containing protein [Bacteroidales bacterium]|nr:TIM44-like domain-containing protein [Bacteroidales bacterium]MDD4216073.1 TIM44-like domain-containing protein [Bacteroidales bacterium]MDY0141209.1 TIM44-like domain-containing protein [Bacteroidales bacterium]
MKRFLKFLAKNRQILFFILLFAGACLISTDIFARMGGAGGSNNGGGGGDGIGELIFMIFMLLPFPFNWIVVIGLLIGVFVYSKLKKRGSILNKVQTSQIPSKKNEKALASFKLLHPNFDENQFHNKVKTAFTDIQNAWAAKDINRVRRFITDGMYQRVNTQFKMMNILEQRNEIEKLTIKSTVIDKIESDGLYDIIHVAVFASIKDKFISDKYTNLSTATFEEFVEYWSFIRKISAKGTDMYSTYNCPNCGGDLSGANLSDVSKCPYCGTFTNSGEFDWVLAEITQADDYATTNHLHNLSDTLANKIEDILDTDEDFSVQLIEDKASNGYLQIQTARVMKNPKITRRFVSDEYYNKLENLLKSEEHFVYNRIFINDVTLIGALQNENKNILALAIKSSFQRVKIIDGKAQLLDFTITSKNEVLMMSKDIASGENKGSVYAQQCPSCGGIISDTTDINCPYCGNLLNSTKNEWIITDIMSQEEYLNYYKANASLFVANVNPKKLDATYKVRDYAFNNVLIMVAADGVFDNEEMDFVNKLAKKWGYAPSKLAGMLDMAKNNQLVIRMPEKSKDRDKIYKLMYKAASIDGYISPEEQSLLDNIKKEYLEQD